MEYGDEKNWHSADTESRLFAQAASMVAEALNAADLSHVAPRERAANTLNGLEQISALTHLTNASRLMRMGFVKPMLSVVLMAAVGVYAFDCSPTATAEQAMQCCNSMQCMRHDHHSQDCCKTMPSTRDAVGQPSSATHSFAPVAVGLVEAFSASPEVTTSARLIADQCHAPPILSPPAVLPLRI